MAKLAGSSWSILNIPITQAKKVAASGEVLWVASNDKLAKWNGTDWEVFNSPKPNEVIISIFLDGSSVWVVFGDKTVGKFDGAWSIFTESSAYPYNIISKAFEVHSAQNKIWFAIYKSGFASLDRVTSSFSQHSYGPSGFSIPHVVLYQGFAYVVSRDGDWNYYFERFNIAGQTWETLLKIDGPNSMVLFDGKILFGYPDTGIVSYDTSTGTRTTYQTGSSTVILDVIDDYVWISNSSGTYRSNSLLSWEKIFDNSSRAVVRSDNGIWAILGDWMNSKLYFYNISTGELKSYTTEDGLLPGWVYSIALFDEKLWISYYGSNNVTRLDLTTGSVTHFGPSNSTISKYVNRILAVGENLWFTYMTGGGIAYCNSTGWGSYPDDLISAYVNHIACGDGSYWFGTELGLIALGSGTLRTLQTLKQTMPASQFQISPIAEKGTYYLMSILKNNFGQIIDEGSATIQIYERATQISISANKAYYKKGEYAEVNILVENNAPIRLDDTLKITLDSTSTIPVSIPPRESYLYTLNLVLNSIKEISANVTGASATKTIPVITPTADVSIDMPDSVGRSPFNVSVFVNNTSPIPISFNLRINDTSHPLTLQVGESVTVSKQFQIKNDCDIVVQILGDISHYSSKTVKYVERCDLSFITNAPYKEGKVSFNYTAVNTGEIDTSFDLTAKVGDNVKSISISLSPGGSKSGSIEFDLIQGNYKFEYNYYMGSGSIDFTVYKSVDLELDAKVEAKAGKLELEISVKNLVPFQFLGNLTWDVGFLKNSTEISLASLDNANFIFSEPLPDIVAGNYKLEISLTSNGTTFKTFSKAFQVLPPKFDISMYPLKSDYTVGEEISAVFNITNIGGIKGSLSIECEIPGEYKSSQTVSLMPAESQDVVFSAKLPDDLVDGLMKLLYRYEGKEYVHVFRYIGYSVSVNVTMDKPFYNEGENATLTFAVQNLNDLNIQNMSLVVKFGNYENTVYTSLAPKSSKDIVIENVPVSNSGRKLFYSVYLVKHSGRSLVIDSLYLPIFKDVVQVWSDKQVYNIGDTIKFFINSSATGTFKYEIFGTTNTLDISSINTIYEINVVAPELPAGTYAFDYSLSNAVKDSYKFDLNGYRTKILKVNFDKHSYMSGEKISGNLTVWSNLDTTANFTASLLPPNIKVILDWNTKDVNLVAGENTISFELNLTQSASPGDYAVEFSITKGDYTLSHGTKYVSVEGSVINSLSTDRRSYKQNETAVLTVVLYGTTQSTLKIKSGTKLIAESVVSPSGLLSLSYSIPVKELKTTTLEASLITSYSSSSKKVAFGIINMPPKAVAGSDKTVKVHSTVTFDGSGSSDPGDDPLTYSWDFGDGTNASGPIVNHVYGSTGVYTVKLLVADSKGAYDIATLKVNVVDDTPPVISSLSPSNGSTLTTNTPSISASFFDNVAVDPSKVVVRLDDVDVTALSKVSSTDFNYTPSSPLANGLHTVYISVSDLYNNKAVMVWSFTVSVPVAPVSPPAPAPAPVSPPPTPAPAPTPPSPITNTTASLIVSIVANTPFKVEILSIAPRSSLESIEIVTNESLSSVQITTEEYSNSPTSLSLPSTVTPVSFIKIETNIPSGAVTQATIRFRVPRNALTSFNLDPTSIQLYRLTINWNPLTTSMVGRDADYYYYEALSPGFSYFAIVGRAIETESVPPTILSVYPEDGTVLSTKSPTITVTYSDNIAVDITGIRMLFDNVDVTALATLNSSTLVYRPAADLSEGSHSLYFEVKDTSGNKASKSWSFTIADTTPPTITITSPAKDSVLTTKSVTISASYSDNVAINVSSVVLKVDNVDVTSRATVTATGVTYSATLDEGTHTVSLTVKDTSGNSASSTWSFTIRLPVDYTPYVVGVIILIILIAAIYVLLRKK
ncbi:MAG: PKD domain-containing protein [Candidatus Methanomethyliaceae archaeon]|nr:PKD domain-containing protein [Candidatus Methanomethyliaceae archaeon]